MTTVRPGLDSCGRTRADELFRSRFSPSKKIPNLYTGNLVGLVLPPLASSESTVRVVVVESPSTLNRTQYKKFTHQQCRTTRSTFLVLLTTLPARSLLLFIRRRKPKAEESFYEQNKALGENDCHFFSSFSSNSESLLLLNPSSEISDLQCPCFLLAGQKNW